MADIVSFAAFKAKRAADSSETAGDRILTTRQLILELGAGISDLAIRIRMAHIALLMNDE